MKDESKIKPSLMYEYDKAQHAIFHKRILSVILEAGIENLNISFDDFGKYDELINLEIDINERETTKEITEKLGTLDHERCDAFRYIAHFVEVNLLSPNSDNKQNAKILEPVITQYKPLLSVKRDDRSTMILGFEVDIDKEPYKSAANALQMQVALASLAAKNASYESYLLTSQAEKREKKLPQSVEVRPQTDALYNRFCDLIQASLLLAATDEAKAIAQSAINKMNDIISEMKTSYKQSQAHKHPVKKE